MEIKVNNLSGRYIPTSPDKKSESKTDALKNPRNYDAIIISESKGDESLKLQSDLANKVREDISADNDGKVESLMRRIEEGSYRIDIDKIAAKLMFE